MTAEVAWSSYSGAYQASEDQWNQLHALGPLTWEDNTPGMSLGTWDSTIYSWLPNNTYSKFAGFNVDLTKTSIGNFTLDGSVTLNNNLGYTNTGVPLKPVTGTFTTELTKTSDQILEAVGTSTLGLDTTLTSTHNLFAAGVVNMTQILLDYLGDEDRRSLHLPQWDLNGTLTSSANTIYPCATSIDVSLNKTAAGTITASLSGTLATELTETCDQILEAVGSGTLGIDLTYNVSAILQAIGLSTFATDLTVSSTHLFITTGSASFDTSVTETTSNVADLTASAILNVEVDTSDSSILITTGGITLPTDLTSITNVNFPVTSTFELSLTKTASGDFLWTATTSTYEEDPDSDIWTAVASNYEDDEDDDGWSTQTETSSTWTEQ